MPQYGYESPGGAFTNAIDEFMVRQAAQKRQAMVDQIALQRELREGKQAQERIDEEKLRTKLEYRQKDRDEFNRQVHDELGPGDIPPPEWIQKDKELGTGHFRTSPPPTLPVPPPTLAATPPTPGAVPTAQDVQGPPGVGIRMTGGMPAPPKVYPGTFAQREKVAGKSELEALQNQLTATDPNSPQFKQTLLRYETLSGKPLTGPEIKELLGGQPSNMEAVARQHPTTGKMERLVNGQWVPVTGDLPKGTHFEPQPPREPREPNPQPQVLRGPDGKDHFIQFINGKAHEVPMEGFSKPTAQERATTANKKTGLDATTRLTDDISEADAVGLLGPLSGRYYDALAKLGTTGDPVKDKLIGRIKSDILLTKMHVDAGIGGTRAASSPLLLKNWEDIAISGSKDLLGGYLSAIREDMGGEPEKKDSSPRAKTFNPKTRKLE